MYQFILMLQIYIVVSSVDFLLGNIGNSVGLEFFIRLVAGSAGLFSALYRLWGMYLYSKGAWDIYFIKKIDLYSRNLAITTVILLLATEILKSFKLI